MSGKIFWKKADWTLILPFLIFVIAFSIHYYMVIDYHEKLFQYHEHSVKEGILNAQKQIFRINLIGNSILLVCVIIGTILTLNIGFIYYGYKFRFKDICVVVLKSSISIVLIYLALPIIMFFNSKVYTFDELYNIEFDYTLSRYLSDFSPIWLRNLLESFSISQIVFLALIVVGIKSIMNWNIIKSAINVLKIYGLGFLIWHSFALIMDVNFHQ